MDTSMAVTLLIAVASFTVMYIAMMIKRMELARLDDEITIEEQSHQGPAAGDAVVAPDLTGGV